MLAAIQKMVPSLSRFLPQGNVSSSRDVATKAMGQRPRVERGGVSRPLAEAPRMKIVSEKDIPYQKWSLISAGDGPFKLNGQLRRVFAILQIHDEGASQHDCFVLAKTESFGDTPFLDLRTMLLQAGMTIKGYGTTDAGFIAKLYEASVSVEQLEISTEQKEYLDLIDNDLIGKALEMGTSDIHILLRDTGAEIFFRINGDMEHIGTWGLEKTSRIERVMFTLADEKTKETTLSEDKGQSMSIKRIIRTAAVKLRVQSEVAYPVGRDIVMRLLPEGKNASVKTLVELGYAPGHLLMLNTMLSSPSGVIIVSGTTGSGKSTTLQTMMFDIRQANPGQKMYSIEDPPEYILHGVTQIPVRSGVEGAYNETMRNAMRMDPDTLMVGELRDSTAVELLTGMVQSGHKVLTTIHAASAFGITERLNKLNLDFATIAGRNFISGLIFQVLVPMLCHNCRVPYDPESYGDYESMDDESMSSGERETRLSGRAHLPKLGGNPGLHARIERVARDGDTIYVRGDGCPHCRKGIKGRTVCAEMVIPNAAQRKLLQDGKINEAYDHWRRLKRPGSEEKQDILAMAGMTALDHGIHKMRKGDVSPVDVEAVLGFLTGYDAEEEIMDPSTEMNFGVQG